MNQCEREGGARECATCNRETCECARGEKPATSGLAAVKGEGEAVAYAGTAPEPVPTPVAELIAYLREDAKRGFYFEINGADAKVLLDEIERLQTAELLSAVVAMRNTYTCPACAAVVSESRDAHDRACPAQIGARVEELRALRAAVAALLPYATREPDSAAAKAIRFFALDVIRATDGVDA
jgi:hypothetical protein